MVVDINRKYSAFSAHFYKQIPFPLMLYWKQPLYNCLPNSFLHISFHFKISFTLLSTYLLLITIFSHRYFKENEVGGDCPVLAFLWFSSYEQNKFQHVLPTLPSSSSFSSKASSFSSFSSSSFFFLFSPGPSPHSSSSFFFWNSCLFQNQHSYIQLIQRTSSLKPGVFTGTSLRTFFGIWTTQQAHCGVISSISFTGKD